MTNDLFNKTPSSSGYRMPAEWEKHDAVWLSWPHDAADYPNGLDKVQKTYIQIIKAISNSEKVQLIVKDDPTKEEIEELLKKENIQRQAAATTIQNGKLNWTVSAGKPPEGLRPGMTENQMNYRSSEQTEKTCSKNKFLQGNSINKGQINFHILNYADIWIRDYGPIFIVNQNEKKLAMTHWIFNAWGEKYEELKNDTVIPSMINQSMNIPCFTPGIILEGGSIDVNGKGALITTEQCLLNKNRNPDLSKTEIERCLMEYIGIKKIIWLKEGITADDTDGHIDNIARFVSPSTILCAYEDDKEGENYNILKNNYDILENARDQDGNKFNIIKLPMPGVVGDAKRRFSASYANFYIGNNVVLVPVFGHENDQRALYTIQCCFPSRKIVGINCSYLLHGGGAIHCISQQQPAIS